MLLHLNRLDILETKVLSSLARLEEITIKVEVVDTLEVEGSGMDPHQPKDRSLLMDSLPRTLVDHPLPADLDTPVDRHRLVVPDSPVLNKVATVVTSKEGGNFDFCLATFSLRFG